MNHLSFLNLILLYAWPILLRQASMSDLRFSLQTTPDISAKHGQSLSGLSYELFYSASLSNIL